MKNVKTEARASKATAKAPVKSTTKNATKSVAQAIPKKKGRKTLLPVNLRKKQWCVSLRQDERDKIVRKFGSLNNALISCAQ